MSPDGDWLTTNHRDDIWMVPIRGGEPKVLIQTPFVEGGANFSPDGQWIVYQGFETGTSTHYIRRADGSGPRITVSARPPPTPAGRETDARSSTSSRTAPMMTARDFQRRNVGSAAAVVRVPLPLRLGRRARRQVPGGVRGGSAAPGLRRELVPGAARDVPDAVGRSTVFVRHDRKVKNVTVKTSQRQRRRRAGGLDRDRAGPGRRSALDRRRRPVAAVSRTGRTRHRDHHRSGAAPLEPDREHRLARRDRGSRPLVAGGVERPRVPHHRGRG